MKEKLISIIVPVYNVEKYLAKCINSLINQTYNNLEVLLIDDGSTDNSLIICEEFQKKDSRIKVIHKQNGGLSSARNTGIDNSNGEYLLFIDSDDWIKPNFVEILSNVAIDNNVDLVVSGLINTFLYDYIDNMYNSNHYEIISKEDMLKKVLYGENGIDVSACGKLYNKNVFCNLKYDEGQLYEDFLIIDKIINNCQSFAIVDYRGYYYYQRENSIMHSKYNDKRYVLINKSEEIIDLANEYYTNVVPYAIYRYMINNLLLLKMTISDNDFKKEASVFRNNILKYKKELLCYSFIENKYKLIIKMLSFNILIFKIFWNFKLIIKKVKGDI